MNSRHVLYAMLCLAFVPLIGMERFDSKGKKSGWASEFRRPLLAAPAVEMSDMGSGAAAPSAALAMPNTSVVESSPTKTPIVVVHRDAARPSPSCWQRVRESMHSCGNHITDSWRGLSQGTRNTLVVSILLATTLAASAEDAFGGNELVPALIHAATGVAMGYGPLAKYAFWGKALAVGIEVPVDVTTNWFLARAGQMHCPHTGFLAVAMGLTGLSSIMVEKNKREAVSEARRWTLRELALALSVAPKVIDALQKIERDDRTPATLTQRVAAIRSLYQEDARAFGWEVRDLDRASLQVEKVIAWRDLGAIPKLQEVLKAKLVKAQSAQAV